MSVPTLCPLGFALNYQWQQPKQAFSHLGYASEASETQENLWMQVF